ncbi:hypothetical protein L7F22_010267 [Adiantum nelumboides]|nr:hypothetical protein [Adiantum nelumboides]
MSNFVQSSLLGMRGFVQSERPKSNETSGSKRRKVSVKKHVSTLCDKEIIELVNDEYFDKDKLAGEEEMSRRQCARSEWNEAWVRTFDWAVFDRELARIFCAFCRQDPKSKSEFGKSGSINIQISALSDHAKTNAHKLASYQCGANKILITETLEIRKDKADRASRVLFSAAYQVAKHDMSFCSFEHNLELLQVVDCECVPLEMYRNDKACAMFVQYISEVILKSHVSRINMSPFFSLMLDESTDIGNKQNLIVYVSYLEQCEPVTKFLGLIELENGTSACMYETCMDFLSKYGLDISKMICFGSDGASSMVGCRNGLSTRLKRENPFMTNIHCIAHRTSLCLADAVKEFQVAQDIDTCMNSIASIFSRSSCKSKVLESLQVEFNGTILHLSRIHNVRWLSRQSVVKKVCDSYEAILAYTKAENVTLFNKLANFEFMYNLHFLFDVLDRLGMLSRVFQYDFVDVTAVASFIDMEIRALEMFFIDDPIVDMNASTHDRCSFHIIPGTASCERGFSKQNLIKSKLRNHLNVRTVESLMRISIEGPSLRDFDFLDAIEMWRQGAKTSRHLFGDTLSEDKEKREEDGINDDDNGDDEEVDDDQGSEQGSDEEGQEVHEEEGDGDKSDDKAVGMMEIVAGVAVLVGMMGRIARMIVTVQMEVMKGCYWC